MSRITREQMFLEMARAASKRSTCFRLNVGAVVVQERNVIAVGYNGAPAKQPHCSGNGCQYFDPERGCQVVHAERNALDHLPTHRLDGLELYVTHSPCRRCAELAVDRRVARVYFEVEYRDRTPLEYLIEKSVGVYRILPSGFVVDVATGSLWNP